MMQCNDAVQCCGAMMQTILYSPWNGGRVPSAADDGKLKQLRVATSEYCREDRALREAKNAREGTMLLDALSHQRQRLLEPVVIVSIMPVVRHARGERCALALIVPPLQE